MRQPFFKREADQSNMERISEIQTKIDQKEIKIREAKIREKNADIDL
jgi:hypothetical protein